MKVNFKEKDGKLFLNRQLKTDEGYSVIEKEAYFKLTIYKKPIWVKGITSMCSDMKHILMIDYDDVCRWIVEKELEELSKDHSPLYLFSTKEEVKDGEQVGNYHSISLEKFYPNEIIKIQNKTSCDNAYRTMPLRNRFRSWCLRLSEKGNNNKPTFIKVIGNKNLNAEISSPHLKALKQIYKLPYIKYTNKDNLSELFINHYETRGA